MKLPKGMAHELVAKTAQDMAAATYEEWAKTSNTFYAENRSQKKYVKQAWPLFVTQARATLAQLLTTNIAEHLKEEIKDALVKDNIFRESRENQLQARQ